MPASHDKSCFFSETRVLHFQPPFIIVRYLCVKFITICTFSLSFFIFFTYLKKNDIPIRYRWPLRHSDNSAHFFLTILVLTSLYLGSSEIFLLEENWLQNVFTSICTQALVKYFCFEKKKKLGTKCFHTTLSCRKK